MTSTLTTIRETRRRLYEDDCRLARLEFAFAAGDEQASALLEDYGAGPLAEPARDRAPSSNRAAMAPAVQPG